MKYLLLLCLLLSGCNDQDVATTTRNNNYGPPFQEIDGNARYCATRIMMVTNEGHRFLIVKSSSYGAVSVCEVTDASLIKTNAEKP